VSYRHVQQLTPIQDEFTAVRSAVALLVRSWPEVRHIPETANIRFPQVRAAERNLETTYLIRLFAMFEAILGEYLIAVRPGRRSPRLAEQLINRAALYARLPDAIRDAAHVVRRYRNAVVHRPAAPATAVAFPVGLAQLNRFLASLPDPT
jgi:hypothetical protein